MGWKKITPVQHDCRYPRLTEIIAEKAGTGSIWECECGIEYTLTRNSYAKVTWGRK